MSFFELKVSFNLLKWNIKIYEMFCKTEWKKNCLNLMIFFIKFVVLKGRGGIPFYTKWREIISVSQTCFIRKRKIRERKEERQILVLPKIDRIGNNEMFEQWDSVYIFDIYINKWVFWFMDCYIHVSCNFFSPSAHLTSLGLRPSIFLSPLSPNPQSVFG